MKKKSLLLLCAIMALFLSARASASGDDACTIVKARCNLPNVSVIVPATAQVFINPYKLPLSVEATETTAQIVSAPACIENRSAVPLDVTVTVTGMEKEGSDMRLISYSTQNPDLVFTNKSAFVYFEMQATAAPDEVEWDDEFNSEKHLVVSIGRAITWKGFATIASMDQPKHFGAFRLAGDCVQFPREGWTEADGIDVEIAFTFTPLPIWTEIS